jgi:hypothetical protein
MEGRGRSSRSRDIERRLGARTCDRICCARLIGYGLEYWADSPRTFGPASQQRFADTLKKFRGTPFDFSVELDPEAVALMEDIGTALDAAGWKRKAVAQGSGYSTAGI